MRTTTLPLATGLGLRSPHLAEVLATKPPVAWWEVHSENYFGGGAPLAALHKVREHYPVSLHGVGLGLGNPEGLDDRHLDQLAFLVETIQPAAVSEHVCWNRHGSHWYNDLLPVPRHAGVLDVLTRNIDRLQQRLNRKVLLENISAYVQFRDEIMTEAELLTELVKRTGCGLLLDVNNLYVNQLNHRLDARDEISRLPLAAVEEIHVAGFEVFESLVIDTHGAPIHAEVYELLAWTLARTGPRPVLLERDTHLPALPDLLQECRTLSAHVNAVAREGAVA
ncbi:MAG: DUF692 domain-containing protein [Formivibrio sp.]|nr:DUF692 domain-containing protein [Formivibrio sp.]